jgi:isopenicillin-N epimerase
VEAILSKVTPRTRLALIDHVTSPTALVFPIERIVRELDARGVETLVDGAHAPGMLPLDLDRLGAAYYTGNGHKWLCAPKGSAFLYGREDLRASVRPLVISHGANRPLRDRSRFQEEFAWTGTGDPTPFICLGEAVRYMGSLLPGGWPELMARNREKALAGRHAVCERLGIEEPAPAEMIGSIASIPLPPAASDGRTFLYETDPLQAELRERWHIEIPVVAWPSPPARVLRLSAQLYNAAAEYERLAEALAQSLGASRGRK